MTLASHARGPEFEPRCEYYQNFCEQIFVIPRFFCEKKPILSSWDVFFLPQPIYFGEKKGFIPKTVTPQSPADRGFTVCIRLKRLWSWYKPVLGLTTSFMERCGIVAYKFFQNWLRVRNLVSSLYIWAQTHQLSVRLTKMDDQKENTVSLFKETRNGQKKKFWPYYRWMDSLCLWVNGGAERLAAPGSSAKPGPRSWSASKPSAWSMDVAQTIQLISFVTM